MTKLLHIAVGSLAMPLLFGCGAAGLVLKSPLTDKCTDAGLKGCPVIVDGVMDYVEGNKAEGLEKLKKGAAENAPENVQEFAAMIQPLMKLPGVESYTGPLKEIVDLLAKSAKSSETRKRATAAQDSSDGQPPKSNDVALADRGDHDLANPYRTARGPDPAPPARWPAVAGVPASPPAPSSDVAHMRTRTFVPATDSKAVACEGPLGIVPGGTCARVPVMLGPFVVTDLFAPGGCGDQLFVSSDSTSASGWMTFNAAIMALSLHGMQLVVQSDEKLYVGARSEKGPLRSDGLRCTVTVSGWRPDALE
ncbi:MAG TPA: hypothetical protein VGL81_21710 [Polyangiaceae bacterium]|jgi:hypothetical protein